MQNKIAMRDFVIDMLKSKIPATYFFHNYLHTEYVIEKVIEIGKKENCSEKELELLYAAATWHDVGYVNIYQGHEAEGCKIAKQYLHQYGYNDSDIEIICSLIMATQIPTAPKNKLEAIIADADLEYLGTDKAKSYSDLLFQERKHLNDSITLNEWNRVQVEFIKKHQYYTDYCKKDKEPSKQKYLEDLMRIIS